jgi:hypothetical protein
MNVACMKMDLSMGVKTIHKTVMLTISTLRVYVYVCTIVKNSWHYSFNNIHIFLVSQSRIVARDLVRCTRKLYKFLCTGLEEQYG